MLKLAHAFDTEFASSNDLFPPPLVKKQRDLKNNLKPQVWSLPKKTEKFDLLRINGKKVDFSSGFIKRVPGPLRLSFYSNKWRPQSFQLNIDEIDSLNLATIPLAKGSCHNPVFNTKALTQSKMTLFDQGCTGSTQSQLAQLPREELDLNFKEKTVSRSKFYQNKWFWIGLSVVAVSLTAYQIDQNNKKHQPNAGPTNQPNSKDPVVFSNN